MELPKIPFRLGYIIRLKIFNFFKGSYLSYLPDRYSFNLKKHQKLDHSFYNNHDIKNWVKYNYINNAGDLVRFFFLNMVLEQIDKEDIKGDIIELGVYMGNSASLFAAFVRKKNRELYLFDTFSGFDKRDLTGRETIYKESTFSDTSLEKVKSVVGLENVKYIEGYFPESLSKIENHEALNFCLVHIDCDLEKPIKDSLEYFYPKLSKGGFLIIHDYASLNWDGATMAIDEFFKDKLEKLIPIPDKSGTVVVRKI